MELLCATQRRYKRKTPPWEHTSFTNILTQPQTRMEYKHFETSETFEPFTGKRKNLNAHFLSRVAFRPQRLFHR